MRNIFRPPPAPPGFAQDQVVPEERAGLLSKLIFYWLGPLLTVGFTRPLQKDDLWKLPERHLTASLTDRVEANFYSRCPPDERPVHLREGLASIYDDELTPADDPKGKANSTTADKPPDGAALPKKKTGKPKYDKSLVKALHAAFWFRWWGAGFMLLISETMKTTTPLVTKALLRWLAESYVYHRLSAEEKVEVPSPRGIGYGIGVGIALFVMQEGASLVQNHCMLTSMASGLYIRTSIIGAILRKAMRLSGKSRADHSVGQITTMISTDSERLEQSAEFFHYVWIGPIQVMIGIGLLIQNLGYSALVGLGVLIFSLPFAFLIVRVFFTQRQKGVEIADKRVRLTSEVLQGVRLIKYYAWEAFYGHQIGALRAREVRTIRKTAIAGSFLIALMTFVPILASVLSFIAYALSGHALSVAVIFSSLQLFNVIRMPLAFFPMALSSVTDAVVALTRIGKYLSAEEMPSPYAIDEASEFAVDVDGDFQWEVTASALKAKFDAEAAAVAASSDDRGGGGKKDKKDDSKPKKKTGGRSWFRKKKPDTALPTTAAEDKPEETELDEVPFALKDVKLRVRKGAFVAIIGRIGTGKSSLLQAMLGEMKRTRGELTFGGSVAYVPQSAWIMNATLRQNVLFGRQKNEEKFQEIVRACALEHDLEMLPHGDETEIGERGINLSGGQKARVSLARAAYAGSDILLLDDPLSAVDAHVGKHILQNCLLSGPLSGKTRIMATHALHVLDKVNYIYVMDDGAIAEEGTFSDLMSDSVIFSRLMDEYGSLERDREGHTTLPKSLDGQPGVTQDGPEKTTQAALMQTEERNTGAVTAEVYTKYLSYAGSIYWAPAIISFLLMAQGAAVSNNIFLGFWTSLSIDGFSQGDYMAVYAGLGCAQAVLAFATTFSINLAALHAGLRMFRAALAGVLRSPVSFFDTTPMGRIITRLSKDQDTVDNEIWFTLNQFLEAVAGVIGTIALVFYTFPYLGLIFVPLSIFYLIAASYYRRTSVETKRLDSLMRSALYATYSETLTGLPTVRAYREQERFVKTSQHGLDMENRAYYMTVTIQRWLGIRLDFMGNLLILGIALFAVGFRDTISPSKVGVVLTYSLSITQILSDMVSEYATNEQNMNAVERILVYTELPGEGAAITPQDPPPSWPEQGEVKFKNVSLAYRPGLPLVLKDITFTVNAGEKVGIVGRTGAGKSSLLQALFRMVELQGGSIEIDGCDISDMGLIALRSQLALVPQDGALFQGTLRENIDPQASRTDAELMSALQRSWLLPRDGSKDAGAEAKFGLDASVNDEGSNYSAGEKQLVALCRALVKNSRIIILDEATASVDVETDAKLQATIQTEFVESTLLCIAHRLNTIAYYDRILVMDEGTIAEFDTPLALFDTTNSIFRSLCDEASLSRQDIVRIRATFESASAGPSLDKAMTVLEMTRSKG